MKKILIILSVVALSFLASCGKSKREDKTPLEFWTFFSGGDGEYMEKLVTAYNNANPDNPVKAIIVDWGTYYTKLSTAYLGDSLPDIATAHAHMLNAVLTYGKLTDINEIDETFDFGQFPKTTENNVIIDEKHLAIPFDTHGWVMYYNPYFVKGTSLVNLEGEWEANTWEDLTKGLNEVKKKHPNVMPITINNPDTAFQWTWYTLYKQAGGNKFLNEDGMLELDKEPAQKALDALKSLFDKGYALKGHNGSFDFMKEGKAAITFEGVWIAGGLREANPNIKAQTIPPFMGKEVAWGTGHVLIVPRRKKSNTRREERAVKFAQWMIDNGALWANAGHIPAQIKAQESEEYKNNPNSVFKDLSIKLATWPKSEYLDTVIGGQISILENQLDKYINGNIKTIDEIIKNVNEELLTKR